MFVPRTNAITELNDKRALLIYPDEEEQPVEVTVEDSPDGRCSVKAWQSGPKEPPQWENLDHGNKLTPAQIKKWQRYLDGQAVHQAVESLRKGDSRQGYDLELFVDDEA